MAISGSSNFAVTRNDVIRQAALDVSAVGAGVTMGAQMQLDFAHKLNALVKSWQETGIHIWTTKEATLFPAVSQVRYGLGSGATDHATESYVETAIRIAASSGATVLSVDSITGFSSGDNIGILLDDGTLQWTTINGAPAALTITIATGLTDTAAVGNKVYAYTTRMVRPLRVLDLRRHEIESGDDTPLGEPISRMDYQALPRKTDTGAINQVWYDPQNTLGYLYLWQALETVDHLLKFTWAKPIDDFDSATDNPDLPQGWALALEWNLALNMTAQYPVSDRVFKRIAAFATKYLDEVSTFDREPGPVFFQPRMR